MLDLHSPQLSVCLKQQAASHSHVHTHAHVHIWTHGCTTYACVCIYACAHVDTNMCVHGHAYTQCVHLCAYMHMYMWTERHALMCMHMCAHVCVHVDIQHMHVHAHVHIHMCGHSYVCTHKPVCTAKYMHAHLCTHICIHTCASFSSSGKHCPVASILKHTQKEPIWTPVPPSGLATSWNTSSSPSSLPAAGGFQ